MTTNSTEKQKFIVVIKHLGITITIERSEIYFLHSDFGLVNLINIYLRLKFLLCRGKTKA